VALARLRWEALRDPTPGSLVTGVERLFARGETAAASALLERGLALFPDYNGLLDLARTLKREERRVPMQRLREALGRRPDPGIYVQLASLHRELGEIPEAEALCDEARLRFPHDGRAWLMLGEIRAERFKKTLLARDGGMALKNLERAADLSSEGRRPRVLLADLYASLGAPELAIRHLDRLLELDPTEKWARALKEDLTRMEPSGRDIESLLFEVERRGRLLRTFTAMAEAALPDEAELRARAERGGRALRSLRGVRSLAVLREGEVLVEIGPQSVAAFGSLAVRLLKATRYSARKMDAGELRRAVFEGPFGRLLFAGMRGLTVALLVDGGFQIERLLHQVEEVFERASRSVVPVEGGPEPQTPAVART